MWGEGPISSLLWRKLKNKKIFGKWVKSATLEWIPMMFWASSSMRLFPKTWPLHENKVYFMLTDSNKWLFLKQIYDMNGRTNRITQPNAKLNFFKKYTNKCFRYFTGIYVFLSYTLLTSLTRMKVSEYEAQLLRLHA